MSADQITPGRHLASVPDSIAAMVLASRLFLRTCIRGRLIVMGCSGWMSLVGVGACRFHDMVCLLLMLSDRLLDALELLVVLLLWLLIRDDLLDVGL